MNSKGKWKTAGLFYFTFVFFLIPAQALAYIDPSVTSYAVQALAGVAVAAGAFFAAYGRKTRRLILKGLGIDDHSGKPQEEEAEIYMEELREETAARKAAFEAAGETNAARKKTGIARCIILSLICGLAAGMTLILRPSISFYLDNEGEFWFSLGSIMKGLLYAFGAITLLVAIVHALLPDRKIKSPRLLFAALIAVLMLCAYIQNHFMSSYLPVLTGDPIDWSQYSGWGLASAVLWGSMIILAIVGFAFKPRITKVLTYSVLLLLLCLETFAGGYALIAAKHENKRAGTYCSTEGLYQASKAGNIVILVSDTFEGTYMNEILERYPEYKDMLNDVTYYDNTTGISVLTYLSYSQMMTGVDVPLGMTSEEAVRYCFEHESTVDTVVNNGWDVAYYTTFSPTENLRTKLINYASEELIPDEKTALTLAHMIINSTLFQSMPQLLKPNYMVYTIDYEKLKEEQGKNVEVPTPFVDYDPSFYKRITEDGTESYEGKPKYSIIQLFGVHEPSNINAEFEEVEYSEEVPVFERKIEAGRGQLKLLREYLDSLKAAGVYEDTTVIMMADHGFNMRYYPVLLVKDAHREEEGFQMDHTPLSLREDLAELLSSMTKGNRFSDTVKAMGFRPDRTRYAIGYRGKEYGTQTSCMSTIEIRGDAKDIASYQVKKDEFLIDDEFPGRYEIGKPFFMGGGACDNAASYGLDGGRAYGHTVLFDLLLNEPADRDVTLRMVIVNLNSSEQHVILESDGQELTSICLAGDESTEIKTPLPAKGKDRIQIEVRMPDAEFGIMQNEALGWPDSQSIWFRDAILE